MQKRITFNMGSPPACISKCASWKPLETLHIAKTPNRMRDFLRQQREAAEHDAWFRRQVHIGQDSANAGNLIPAAEVEAKFAAKPATTCRRLEASE